MATALVALGSNLGDRQAILERAAEQLAQLPQTRLAARSRWYETTPAGGPAGQDAFLNGAVRLETNLPPEELLARLQTIERALGRQRGEHWAARTLDLDLLLYDSLVMRTAVLEVPHPRMAFRRFVLQPAAEIASDLVHPTIYWTIGQLWQHVTTTLNYVAITGPTGVGKSSLAAKLQKHFGGELLLEPVSAAALSSYYANPASMGEALELSFLDHRAGQLAQQRWRDAPLLLVSDYWFDQSLAFSQQWLEPAAQRAVRARYEHWLPTVIRPKLLLALDAPAEELQRRIAARGRPFEQQVTCDQLERLRTLLDELLSAGGHGPLLRIDVTRTMPTAEEEAIAAIEAMRG